MYNASQIMRLFREDCEDFIGQNITPESYEEIKRRILHILEDYPELKLESINVVGGDFQVSVTYKLNYIELIDMPFLEYKSRNFHEDTLQAQLKESLIDLTPSQPSHQEEGKKILDKWIKEHDERTTDRITKN